MKITSIPFGPRFERPEGFERGSFMAEDIVEKLKAWREELIKKAPHGVGEKAEIEIEMLREAIEEIQRLRENQR